jgi:tRNA 2-thiouridine synthesizing protein A
MSALSAGETLLVLATDPGVLHDIPAWCRLHGHEVLAAEKVENEFHVRIQAGPILRN